MKKVYAIIKDYLTRDKLLSLLIAISLFISAQIFKMYETVNDDAIDIDRISKTSEKNSELLYTVINSMETVVKKNDFLAYQQRKETEYQIQQKFNSNISYRLGTLEGSILKHHKDSSC